MDEELITIRCACGWEARGTKQDVVAQTVAHGRQLHNMEPSREQVLAMAATPIADPDRANQGGTT